MLDSMRRGAQSWLAKILFGILIISFGVFWGIEDVFRGFGRSPLATVGETQITAEQFQRELQKELAQISENAGKRITAEEARAFGLDSLVLRRMVSDAALSSHTRDLGLAVSDDTIITSLKSDESLQGPDGKFSRARLDEAMQAMGLSERGLIDLLRKDELKRQLLSALSSAIALPQPLLDVQHSWQAETRKIEHFTIAADKVSVPEPDEAALKATYEANKRQFMVPEYRKLGILLVTIDDLKKEMPVSDEEISKYYEDHKAEYDVAERRRIQQIPFKDKAAAEEAKKALSGGKNFRDAAKDAGATEADINLGMKAKSELIDKAVAEAAFKLKRDEVSDVIDGRFRPVILRVIEIEPGKESTLVEVKEKIRDKIASQKAEDEVQERYKLAEEQRNLAKSLKEIADAVKLRFVEIDATDRKNARPDGGRALDHPDEQAIIAATFQRDKGADGDVLDLKQSGGYGWIDVVSITPEKEKPFEDAKAAVRELHIDTERRRLIDEPAGKLVTRADGGEPLAKLAEEAGGKVETTEAITRQTEPPGLNSAAVDKAFALAKGKAGSAETSDRKSRVVFRVVEIVPAPAITEADRSKLANELRNDFTESQLQAYVEGLTTRVGTQINEAELRRITGASQQQ